MKLEQLSDEQLKAGVRKAIENSLSLIQDGKFLLELDRLPRAFALFQFSNEELGKAIILFHILLLRKLGDEIDYKTFNDEIVYHRPKHRYSVLIEFIVLSMIYSEKIDDKKEYLVSVMKKLNSAKYYDKMKNSSLYIDFVEGDFKTPFEQIERKIVEEIKIDAEFRYNIYSKNIEQRLSEIEITAEKFKEFEKNPEFGVDFKKALKDIPEK